MDTLLSIFVHAPAEQLEGNTGSETRRIQTVC